MARVFLLPKNGRSPQHVSQRFRGIAATMGSSLSVASVRSRAGRREGWALVFPLIAVVAISLLPFRPAVRWWINTSASAPQGLYRAIAGPADVGDYLVFRIPAEVRAFTRSWGWADDDLLMKPGVGVPEDVVCYASGRFVVNDQVLGVTLTRTRQGQPLPQRVGCTVVDRGAYVVFSDRARSFDSRYFGPVDPELVVAVATPFLTWR